LQKLVLYLALVHLLELVLLPSFFLKGCHLLLHHQGLTLVTAETTVGEGSCLAHEARRPSCEAATAILLHLKHLLLEKLLL
jgi:hypothetical protein